MRHACDAGAGSEDQTLNVGDFLVGAFKCEPRTILLLSSCVRARARTSVYWRVELKLWQKAA